MAEVARPKQMIDAIVVGKYGRALTGIQFATLYARCSRHGIQLHCPRQAARSISPIATTENCYLSTQSQLELLLARHRELQATYHPGNRRVRIEANPDPQMWG